VDEGVVDGLGIELPVSPADAQRSVLSEFPRGARPGDALHAVFELCPFAEGTPGQRLECAQKELSLRGFGAESAESVAQCVEQVLKTPLPSERVRTPILMGALTLQDRAAEMEFSLPVGSPARLLSPGRLARALGFEEESPHAPPGFGPGQTIDGVLTPEYLRALAALPFSAWSGFLRGYMDLVYVWEGQLFGLDYKSNHLGDCYSDYTQAALQASMEEHHYLLQALLYAVAIHRYGKARILDYSYERHFGGMHYLFIRGMHPEVSGRGVYTYRPSEKVIEGLNSVLSEVV
jgi:exodeoxyribonuclease V beta subunit